MTEQERLDEKEKLIRDDLRSIENKVRHAFNQGYELGLKQKRKVGNWVETYSEIDAKYGRHSYKCSECGKYAEYFIGGTEVWWDRIKPNFCPNCGARMVSE